MIIMRRPNNLDDLISRRAAIKNAHFPMIDDAGYEVVRVDDILGLPSIEPNTKCIAQIRIDRDDMENLINEKVNEIVGKMSETKTGKWIDREYCQVDEDAYEVAICSECGAEVTIEYPYDSYCPNCGAKMEGGGEE